MARFTRLVPHSAVHFCKTAASNVKRTYLNKRAFISHFIMVQNWNFNCMQCETLSDIKEVDYIFVALVHLFYFIFVKSLKIDVVCMFAQVILCCTLVFFLLKNRLCTRTQRHQLHGIDLLRGFLVWPRLSKMHFSHRTELKWLIARSYYNFIQKIFKYFSRLF